MFKATEMSMKKLLDLLQKTVEQKRSFRSLSLMINKIKGQEAELRKLSEEVMRQQSHQSTASSILNRQTTLITRLNELELRVDLLDDDGQLNQSSSRIRDDVSMISSRRNLSRQSTPAPSGDKERIQHQRDIEEKQTSSNIFNQPPPIPPRPRQPSLLLQTSNEPGLQIQYVLEAHQRNPKKEVQENLIKSKNKLENQTNAPNPFSDQQTVYFLPPGKFDSQEPASFKCWKNVQQMGKHFWKRLVKYYPPTLLKRSKWSDSDQTPLRVNIVWILKDMTPRGKDMTPRGIMDEMDNTPW